MIISTSFKCFNKYIMTFHLSVTRVKQLNLQKDNKKKKTKIKVEGMVKSFK